MKKVKGFSSGVWGTRCINKAAMMLFIRNLLTDLTERFSGVLRNGGQHPKLEWQLDDDFCRTIADALDEVTVKLAQMSLERARARAASLNPNEKEDSYEYTVITQDVLDAFDIMQSSNH